MKQTSIFQMLPRPAGSPTDWEWIPTLQFDQNGTPIVGFVLTLHKDDLATVMSLTTFQVLACIPPGGRLCW